MNSLLIHFVLALSLTSLTTLVLGVFVFLKNPRHTVNRLFAFYSFSISWWSFCQIWLIASTDTARALWWGRVEQIGVFFIPTLFVHFVRSLLGTRDKNGILIVGYMLSILFAVCSLSHLMIADAIPKFFVHHFATPGKLYSWAVLFFLFYAQHALSLLYKAYKHSSGMRKNQIKYLFWSSLAGYVGGSANFLLVYGVSVPLINPFGTYAVPLYVLATAYAIVRYRLMDINFAITRTTVFAGVYALVLGLPLAGALAWQVQLEQWLGTKWWVGLWVVVALLATGAHYLNLHFQRRAEERLRWEERRYQATLAQASHGMTQLRDLRKLLSMIVHVITRTVGLRDAAILLEDPAEGAFVLKVSRYPRPVTEAERFGPSDPLVELLQEMREPIVLEELQAQLVGVVPKDQKEIQRALALSRMQALDASVVVPSFMQERLIGFLVLGEKRNRQVFTSEDLSVFATLANQAALAIENARFFEEMKTNEAYMIQSEKMASLGQLASGMAHEIHNPLAIISGEAQLYLEASRGKSEDVDKLLHSIIQECNRAADITRRILRFAKPGKAEFVPVDVRAVIEESLPLVAYRIRLDRVERQVVFPPDVPKVMGNQNQLQEVFLNLILNACQAMGEQGGKLTITGAVSGGEVEVRVTDTGPGIPYAKLSKIFDPFYTTKHSGTGLGLFVSQRIVRAHNGSMDVQSMEGKGTTFTVRLPAAPEAGTTSAPSMTNGAR